MNLLDRMIGELMPERGLRRARARAAFNVAKQISQRGFDAAKSGPRTGNWKGSSGSVNAELAGGINVIRNRARDLIANNGYIKHALKVLCSNIVGTGISPKYDDDKLKKLWAIWSRLECDANGMLGIGGLQSQIVRAMWADGEVLVRFRIRRPEDGLTVPLQLQVLEADYLDTQKTGETSNGFCICGVQFNFVGQRLGYWLFDKHPGEIAALPRSLTSRFVPASEILHLFDPLGRPGQVRGISEFAVSIWKARDLDDYQDAHSIRKKIEACFAAFITTDDTHLTIGQTAVQPKAKERRVEELSPGLIQYLKPNETINFSNPQSSDGYEETVRVDLRAIAAGTGISYEQLTGDYSQVNFTSGRMGKMEFKAMVEQFQWLVFIPMFCDKVAAKFAQVAYLNGNISKPDILPVSWTAPRIPLLDPLREGQGYKVMREMNVMSRQQIIRELGDDPDEVDAEIEADKYPMSAENSAKRQEQEKTRKDLLKEP